MKFEPTALKDVLCIMPQKFGDDRGFFSEVFKQNVFDSHIENVNFVQDNHSLSADIGTLRGLHFQTPPMAQGKLVRVTRGRVLDVAVDIRLGSPTYGQHVAVELSSDNWKQLWVPAGFAHAFITLEANTEFLYKVTNFYSPEHDGGIRFDDPDLGIDWPIPIEQIKTSDKDKNLPTLAELDNPFVFGENC